VIPLFSGHEPCARKKDWINGFSKGLDRVVLSLRSFHPNRAGQAAYAEALRRYLACLTSEGWANNPETQLPINPTLTNTPPTRCVRADT
jgi:hypothetical protein